MSYRPRILFIDANDSFSNNIISLLETSLGVEVEKIGIHAFAEGDIHFTNKLQNFAAVVCGPGPGSPANGWKDVGAFDFIWALKERDLIPTLGICLGFQSLAWSFGAEISQLPRPRHGLETEVSTSDTSLFAGIPRIRTVQYHSLHVSLGHDVENETAEDALWQPSTRAPQLIPLAWDFATDSNSDPTNPAAILMAVQHASKPFVGVQFHPESICSDESAQAVVRNWWTSVLHWHLNKNSSHITPEQLDQRSAHIPQPRSSHLNVAASSSTTSLSGSLSAASTPPSSVGSNTSHLRYATLDIGTLTVPAICEALRLQDEELIILDSEMRRMQGLGESSIIGLIEADTVKVCYSAGSECITVHSKGTSKRIDEKSYRSNVFTYLKEFLQDRSINTTHESAFCGGFIGYFTYEAGLETLGLPISGNLNRPDICFAFVERSIVVDHVRGKVYVQTIKDNDMREDCGWLDHVERILKPLSRADKAVFAPQSSTKGTYHCQFPSEALYRAKIRDCQNHIRQGDSYEICLTDQTTVSVAKTDGRYKTPWDRYILQRQRNRAPFSAYVRLKPLTLLSSSPERFLCWSRPSLHSSTSGEFDVIGEVTTCQFRPIKGTVKKTQILPCGSTKKVTLAEATAVLSTPKERAENLMIVDLIRHDLHGVVGSGNVSVPNLMVIEEYETVYQLVSVIEGRYRTNLFPGTVPSFQLGTSSCHPDAAYLNKNGTATHHPKRSGIDVLEAALPPGSMTGAPKYRACQLLRDIEEQQSRSIYSGVVGYMCVTGKGDFSVVIRSAYRWDDEQPDTTADGPNSETWHIGAGGAITDLSTEVGEWDEMLGKLHGTLGSFAPGAEASLPR